MNRRTLVFGTAAVAVGAFAGGALLWRPEEETVTTTAAGVPAPAPAAAVDQTLLLRAHAPVVGPVDARVAIVEFFDPACEACRAFYPYVKEILRRYPLQAKLVLRYAAFHEGSEEAVRIIETGRRQGKFLPVLEALLEAQPIWASHDKPDLEAAWAAAGRAGLDVAAARAVMNTPDIDMTLLKDAEDIAALGIRQTPTFYVNGKPLLDFGPEQFADLVEGEVAAL